HYLPEEIFALIVAAETRCLISQGYRYIFIVNGHGAFNHNAVLKRLCIELSNTTAAQVDFASTRETVFIHDHSRKYNRDHPCSL
ncbi:MAG: hypothetical protein PHS63_05740, partial [Desulfoplanes sp.]|nr:hypothetical protein [Desulfoplanes sp.]